VNLAYWIGKFVMAYIITRKPAPKKAVE